MVQNFWGLVPKLLTPELIPTYSLHKMPKKKVDKLQWMKDEK